MRDEVTAVKPQLHPSSFRLLPFSRRSGFRLRLSGCRMSATMRARGVHQTVVTLSGHGPWRIFSALLLAALLALSSASVPEAGARQSEADGAGFVSLALPPGG